MISRLFGDKFVSKKKFDTLNSRLKSSFAKIKYDIELISSWINDIMKKMNILDHLQKRDEYVYNRVLQLENKIKSLEADNTEKAKKLNEVIVYLHKVAPQVKKLEILEKSNQKTMDKIKAIELDRSNLASSEIVKNNFERISRSLNSVFDILKEHSSRLTEVEIDRVSNSSEKLEDEVDREEQVSYSKNRSVKSNSQVITEENKSDDSVFELSKIDSSFSQSEKKVLFCLYNSKDPITYTEISDQSGLNYGTVKNIMSSIRRKGLKIPHQTNKNREKKYYLTKEMKLKITGR